MKYALVNGKILNGHEDMEVLENHVIYVEDGHIVRISSDVLDGYEKIDLKEQYIMPGLINMHVHLPSSGKPQKKEVNTTKLVNFVTKYKLTRLVLQKICESSAKTQLLSGVTTIRTMGGVENYDAIIRDRIESGEILGPRVLASSFCAQRTYGGFFGL